MKFLAVAAGGGLGSVLRYAITVAVTQWLGVRFPLATLGINVAGSLAIGVLAELSLTRIFLGSPVPRLFFITGVLGGFTTFSTFSLDAVALLSEGRAFSSIAYVAASVFAGILAAFGGMALVRAMAP